MAWMAYGLINNSFTQFYPWTDYFGQYVTMTFYYHDVWHTFFKTGYFELYSPNTYLGSDNIGSNSYYGLFDPGGGNIHCITMQVPTEEENK